MGRSLTGDAKLDGDPSSPKLYQEFVKQRPDTSANDDNIFAFNSYFKNKYVE